MRTVILHYHLFKNAGTSVDHLLQSNFQNGWGNREFPGRGGNNTTLVRDWISDTPELSAFSSHTMLGPMPQIKGVRVVPFMLLRDPIERIVSAYHFERRQKAETRGARLARQHDLSGYVNARLATPGDRQCRNFQTARLAGMMPGRATETDRARQALEKLRRAGVVGLVSDFDSAIALLARRLQKTFPDFNVTPVRANTATRPKSQVPGDLLDLLTRINRNDLALVDHLRTQLAAA